MQQPLGRCGVETKSICSVPILIGSPISGIRAEKSTQSQCVACCLGMSFALTFPRRES